MTRADVVRGVALASAILTVLGSIRLGIVRPVLAAWTRPIG